MKSAVYGGLDGTINVLVVILSGIASGTLASKIMSIGISIMLGDGLSMGIGDYLSVKAEKGFIES